MDYSYVLLSEQNRRFHITSTSNLNEHNVGRVYFPTYRRPPRLVYYETCSNAQNARRRKRYLKFGRAGQYVKQCLASWPSEIRSDKLERH